MWKGLRPGSSGFAAPGSSANEAPRFCQWIAGPRQHAARAPLPIERLDVGDRKPVAVDRAHPDRVALGACEREGRGPAHVDHRRLALEDLGPEELRRIVPQPVGIGADPVADRKGALHRLDQPVVVLDRLGAPDAEPLVNAEDEERRETLGRRREVVQARGLELHRERLDHAGPERLEVAARDRAADRLEVGGDLAPDVAAVEVLEPGAGEMRERVAERRQLADRARGRGLALDEEGLGEAGRGVERLGLVRLAGGFRRRHRAALAGKAHGGPRSAASGSRPPSVRA